MDRRFSYTSSYELQDPDPGRKFRVRIRIRISNTARGPVWTVKLLSGRADNLSPHWSCAASEDIYGKTLIHQLSFIHQHPSHLQWPTAIQLFLPAAKVYTINLVNFLSFFALIHTNWSYYLLCGQKQNEHCHIKKFTANCMYKYAYT